MTKVWSAAQRFYFKRIASERQRATADLRSTDSMYARYVAEAKKKDDQKEVDQLRGEWSAVRQPEQDEVDRLLSWHWQKKAERYRIPIPPYGHAPYWEESYVRAGYRLTVKGIDFIENRIY